MAQFPVHHPTVPHPRVRCGVDPAHRPIPGHQQVAVYQVSPTQDHSAVSSGYRRSVSMPVQSHRLIRSNNGIPPRVPSALNPAIGAGLPYENTQNTQRFAPSSFPPSGLRAFLRPPSPIRPLGDPGWFAPPAASGLHVVDIPPRPDTLPCPFEISMPGLQITNIMTTTAPGADLGASAGMFSFVVPSVMVNMSQTNPAATSGTLIPHVEYPATPPADLFALQPTPQVPAQPVLNVDDGIDPPVFNEDGEWQHQPDLPMFGWRPVPAPAPVQNGMHDFPLDVIDAYALSIFQTML
ncbi:hypothetical protein BJ742DRAFT_398244 [Cladochytrium replicatum]|nr:hypothetical protein BJ742DRAFT_398244 [Cladochytrium replicatum]